jgi:hypothetical protein
MLFAQIKEDMTEAARFDMLLQLAEKFSAHPRTSWGYPPAAIEAARQAIPALTQGLAGPHLSAALVRWYETVGRVPELTASQNRLRPPDKLEMQDGVLVLYTENQYCAVWGIPVRNLEEGDPPVLWNEGGGWLPEADRLSRFALTVGLSEMCLCANPFHCSAWMDDAAIAALRSALRLLPVPPLSWPSPERDAYFLAGEDAVVLVEQEFLFASGIKPGLQDYIARLAAPGQMDWTT